MMAVIEYTSNLLVLALLTALSLYLVLPDEDFVGAYPWFLLAQVVLVEYRWRWVMLGLHGGDTLLVRKGRVYVVTEIENE